MERLYRFGAVVLFLFIIGCNDDDLKAPIPAFLTINDVSVATTPSQGSSSDKITDVKVFINDRSLGTFELPTSIPVQTTGRVNLKVRGGIQKNGQSGNKDDYPFYTTYEVDTTLIPETEMFLNPEVSYFRSTIFGTDWPGEDFESGIDFEYHPNSDTVFVRTTDPNNAFEGASGLAYLGEGQTFFEARSKNITDVKRDGRAAYLEMDYKSTHDIAVSIYANGQSFQERLVFFRSRDTYTKVYVELGTVFSTLSQAINYNVAIGYTKPAGEVGQLFVDNVKLVRF